MFNKKRQNIEENLLAEIEKKLFHLHQEICHDFEKYIKCNINSPEDEEDISYLYQTLCNDIDKYKQCIKDLPNTKAGLIYKEAYRLRLNDILEFYHCEEFYHFKETI